MSFRWFLSAEEDPGIKIFWSNLKWNAVIRLIYMYQRNVTFEHSQHFSTVSNKQNDSNNTTRLAQSIALLLYTKIALNINEENKPTETSSNQFDLKHCWSSLDSFSCSCQPLHTLHFGCTAHTVVSFASSDGLSYPASAWFPSGFSPTQFPSQPCPKTLLHS